MRNVESPRHSAFDIPHCVHNGRRRSRRDRARHCSFVASALVPAAKGTPPALEYIARSTTICAGVSPVDSITAPKRWPFTTAPNAGPTATLVREDGGNAYVFTADVPFSNINVTVALPANGDVLAMSR